MLNLDETLEVASTYNTQRDLLFKTLFSSLSACVILDLIREQLPEIDILQLIPGYYLILLFVVFLLVIFITDLIGLIINIIGNLLPNEYSIIKSIKKKISLYKEK